jgi:hypothetical protein
VAKGLFRRVAEKLFPSRQAPVRATKQAEQVRERAFGGSTKAMADAFGVKPRTVERWIDGTRTPPKLSKAAERRWQKENEARAKRGQSPLPRPATAADQLEAQAARVQTTPVGRERRAKQVEQGAAGAVRLRVDRAASFQVRGSSAARPRAIMVDLTGEQAARLVRADSAEKIHALAEEAVIGYFNGGVGGYFGRGDVTFDADSIEIL